MEAELADWVRENRSRLPIVAFMAGRFMDEMPGMRFGHAGTIVEGKADTTADKIARMTAAGISVAERIEDIPALAKKLVDVCPVNIFAQEKDGKLRIVGENLDECVLCELCIQAAPAGTVQVVKLYER